MSFPSPTKIQLGSLNKKEQKWLETLFAIVVRNSENNEMVAKSQLILSPVPHGLKASIEHIMRSAPFNPKLPLSSPYYSW